MIFNLPLFLQLVMEKHQWQQERKMMTKFQVSGLFLFCFVFFKHQEYFKVILIFSTQLVFLPITPKRS